MTEHRGTIQYEFRIFLRFDFFLPLTSWFKSNLPSYFISMWCCTRTKHRTIPSGQNEQSLTGFFARRAAAASSSKETKLAPRWFQPRQKKTPRPQLVTKPLITMLFQVFIFRSFTGAHLCPRHSWRKRRTHLKPWCRTGKFVSFSYNFSYSWIERQMKKAFTYF